MREKLRKDCLSFYPNASGHPALPVALFAVFIAAGRRNLQAF